MTNCQVKKARLIKGDRVSFCSPTIKSFFSVIPSKIPISGKHRVKNCCCQDLTVGQSKNRWMKVSSVCTGGFFFLTEKTISRTVSSKVRGPCSYTKNIVKIFKNKGFLPICYTLLIPSRSNLGEKFITDIFYSSYPGKGSHSQLFAQVKCFFTSFNHQWSNFQTRFF